MTRATWIGLIRVGEQLLHRYEKFGDIEGFVKATIPDRLLTPEIFGSGNQHNRHIANRTDQCAQFDTVHDGHHDVRNDQVGRVLLHFFEGIKRMARKDGLDTFGAKRNFQKAKRIRIVIDYEYAFHALQLVKALELWCKIRSSLVSAVSNPSVPQ